MAGLGRNASGAGGGWRLAAVAALAALTSCGGVEGSRSQAPGGALGEAAGPAAARGEDTGEAVEAVDVALSNNRFAFDLHHRLRDREGNLFASPFSISTALAMTWAGAAGVTQREMAEVLGLEGAPEAVHAGYAELLGALDAAAGDGLRLHVANRLWGQRGFDFLEPFLAVCRDRYGAGLETFDFRTAAEAARRTINAWVAERTEDRIDELLPPGSLDSLTRLVLTNAIYFKGDWVRPFDPDATEPAPFFLDGGGEVEVPLMHQRERFAYARADGLELLRLPYAGERLSMLVLLPERGAGVASIEERLSAERLAEWSEALGRQEVEVYLPRFTVDTRFELADVLATMGMPSAFRPPSPADPRSADFSAMTGERDLFIDQVFHQAFVAVDEEGTEAAAATGVTMKLTMAAAPPPVFRADRPFLFLIEDEESGAILFLGRLARP